MCLTYFLSFFFFLALRCSLVMSCCVRWRLRLSSRHEQTQKDCHQSLFRILKRNKNRIKTHWSHPRKKICATFIHRHLLDFHRFIDCLKAYMIQKMEDKKEYGRIYNPNLHRFYCSSGQYIWFILEIYLT